MNFDELKKTENVLFGIRQRTDMPHGGAARDLLCGKTVLVTGGGGSVGSELCIRVAEMKPKRLIILDIYENNAYAVRQELLHRHGGTADIKTVIASVRDREKMMRVFDDERPDIVFHAAAHKHVPLMEQAHDEAVKNNIGGTLNTADCCERFGTESMILISTDKAIDPTSCMGATKRFCEMIIQSRADSSTRFAAVRFGNVWGSNGSAVELFCRQIAKGGPITLTDRRATRYFMTVTEAAELLLDAAATAKRSEIMALDMGEPLEIRLIAEKLIENAGLVPYRDIGIVETGLRQGERLCEIPIASDRAKRSDKNSSIFTEPPERFDRDRIDGIARMLCEIASRGDIKALDAALHTAVPTYV